MKCGKQKSRRWPVPCQIGIRLWSREVLQGLPSGWDEPRTFCIDVAQGSPGYACALRFEEVEDMSPDDLEGHGEQDWLVTLYPALLDRLADQAVRWVIAHELGHVASDWCAGLLSTAPQ